MYSIRTKGFTLVELMTVIGIVAILTAIAFPSFQGSLRSNRVAAASNELLASLALARSEAIKTGGGGICSSAGGIKCDGTWDSGWLVWADGDGSKTVDADESVIRYIQGKNKLVMTGAKTILTFDARGRSVEGAQTMGIRPDGDVQTPARCVYISATGQTRIAQGACPP